MRNEAAHAGARRSCPVDAADAPPLVHLGDAVAEGVDDAADAGLRWGGAKGCGKV